MISKLRMTIGAFLAVLFLAASGTIGFLYLNSTRTNDAHQLSAEICKGVKVNSVVLGELLERAEELSIKRINEGKENEVSVEELKEFYAPTLTKIEHINSVPC